ncbi:MAG: response regulator transcription factor [Pseudomonadales bacterium]|nr:response regulator transcription factor [Pseudomonadales bacterium]
MQITKKRFLVVEDETDIAELVALHLSDLDAEVTLVNSGPEGLEKALSNSWDVIVLDLRLPGMDGIDVCRNIRNQGINIPIIMLTARSTELDRVLGLEIGADDYMTKPFSALELQARVKALLRRSAIQEHQQVSTADDLAVTTLKYGVLKIDKRRRLVWLNEVSVELTSKEYELLCYFAENPGVAFSRSELLDKVWGYHHQGYEHTVNSHINRLRGKLEKIEGCPQYIQTVWGVGYRFQAPDSETTLAS